MNFLPFYSLLIHVVGVVVFVLLGFVDIFVMIILGNVVDIVIAVVVVVTVIVVKCKPFGSGVAAPCSIN